MEKFKFRMDNLIKNMVYNRKLTIVVLLTVVISMFFPFMTISNLMYQAREDTMKGLYREGDLKLSYVGECLEPDAFRGTLDKLFDSHVDYFFISPVSPVSVGGQTFVHTIAGIDEGMVEKPMLILEGRNLTAEEIKNGADVCLIRPTAKELSNVKIGEYVSYKGKKLEVVGKYSSRDVFAYVAMPAKTLAKISKGSSLQYYLLFTGVDEDLDQIVSTIRKNIDGITADRITTADYKELVKREEEGKWMNFKYNILSGLLISFVSLVTIIAIYIGRLLQNKRNIGIKLSQGSSRRDILIDSILEVLIFSLFAILVNSLIFAFGTSFLSSFVLLYKEPLFYLVSSLVVILLSVLLGLIGGLYVTRSSVSDMVGA